MGKSFPFCFQFFRRAWSILDRTLDGLVETLRIAMVSTLGNLHFHISFPRGCRNVSPPWILWPTRMVLNIIRTIPSLLWALLAVVIVESNSLPVSSPLPFTVLVVEFSSEAFESTDLQAQQALRSGVTPFKHSVMAFGQMPVGPCRSHCLWMLEYNFRSAIIIGYVGAGGRITSSSTLSLPTVGISSPLFYSASS